jgi:hypothetical protein
LWRYELPLPDRVANLYPPWVTIEYEIEDLDERMLARIGRVDRRKVQRNVVVLQPRLFTPEELEKIHQAGEAYERARRPESGRRTHDEKSCNVP